MASQDSPFIKPSEITSEVIQELIDNVINGLTTDGAHHKQYDLEQILKILDPTDSIKQARTKADEESDGAEPGPWEEGIAP